MTIYLQISGQADSWAQVYHALLTLPEPDLDLGSKLSDRLGADSADELRNLDLPPETEVDAARRVARQVSEQVPGICVRLSEREDGLDVQTVGLYYTGQRLAQRTVTWPRRLRELPRIDATETEHRFAIRVMTDLPIRLDTIINELAVHQECVPQEWPVFPVALDIPGAEGSWGQLPGFRAVFALMLGDSGREGGIEGSLACVPLPQPQSLVFLEGIRRPAATVFDLDFQVFGLPAAFVQQVLQSRLGAWGQTFVLGTAAPRPAMPMPLWVAVIGLEMRAEEDLDAAWARLYGLAGIADASMGWASDDEDPHGWADLAGSRFAPRLEGTPGGSWMLAISRRIPSLSVGPEDTVADLLQPLLAQLPAGAWLELSSIGANPWHRRFSGPAKTC
jgi:hypothetical protein